MENDFISRKHLIDLAARQNNLLDGGDVRSAPSVAAVPVVHGHWIEESECQICSNCGEEHCWEDYRAKYCENCGAKMDEEAEDATD